MGAPLNQLRGYKYEVSTLKMNNLRCTSYKIIIIFYYYFKNSNFIYIKVATYIGTTFSLYTMDPWILFIFKLFILIKIIIIKE